MSKYRGYVSCTLALTCGGLLFNASIADGQKTVDRSQDEASLRQTAKQYLSAVGRKDRKAMAEFWTSRGEYVDQDGQSFKISDLIDKAPDSNDAEARQIKVTATTIRFLTADSAIEDGASEITAPGESSPVKGRFSAVWLRQNGKWKLDSLRESRVVTDVNESATERLAVLEPFVGQWSGQNANLTMRVTAEWNPTKTFLSRDLSMTNHGKVVFSAKQQVGWDPVRQEIHSWMFDNHGGHSEGSWSLEGNAWMVVVNGVFSNGLTSSATNLFKFIDRDTVVLKVIDSIVNGEPDADFEMTFTRGDKPAQQGSSPGEPAATSADAEKKAALLAGDTWKRLELEFNRWVSVQVVYSPQQMAKTKAELRAEIEKMSAPELERFIAETDAKVSLLMSKDTREARAWLGQHLSRRTEAYRQKLLGDAPDFANMTSAEIEDRVLRMRSKVRSREQAQASSDANRSRMVNTQLQAGAAASRATAASGSRGSGQSSGYHSPYQPYQSSHEPAARPSYSVGPLGGVYRSLPVNGY